MKKRIAALCLCVVMITSMSGCKKENKESVGDTESAENTETAGSAAIEYDPLDYVELADYNGLEISLDDDYAVDDADVQSFIEENIIKNYPYYTDSDKTTVENGDFVNIDYAGKKDGEAFDGGSAQGTVLEIGSGSFIDGFEEGLIGAAVGDVKDLNLTFPEDYKSVEMAGKSVVFTVTVNKIVDKQDITYDTLTDAYVADMAKKANMSYDTVDAMIADAKSYLESSAESSKQSAIRGALLAKLSEVCTVDKFPEGLLDAREAEALAQYERYYCTDGSALKEYVEKAGQSYDDFVSSVKEDVKTDVKSQMVLEAIAAKEEIEYKEDGFETYVSTLLKNSGGTDEAALYEKYGSTAELGKAYLKKVYVCNLALEKIIESVKVTYNTEDVNDTETALNTEAE